MHDAVYEFVERCVAEIDFSGKRVLEIGSKNVNGTVRPLFSGAFYLGIDLSPGKDVDVVIDAKSFSEEAFWQSAFDVCVSVEALEHCPNPQEIIDCAHSSLRSGGKFIVTAAAPNRTPHRADGEAGDPIENGEFYKNVSSEELADMLQTIGFSDIKVEQVGDGIQGTAIKS